MIDNFISIIIPVYNGEKTIGACLKSLSESANSNFECIVVDDHSSDNTPEIVSSFNVKSITFKKHHGAASARNQGAKMSQGDILLFIDADVTIHPDTLDNIEKAFEMNSEVAAVFGSYDDAPWNSNFFSQYKNLFHHFIHQTSHEKATTFWTGCGAVKKDAFLEIGGFNEDCRMMEDIELGYRLKKAGFEIRLIKDILVKHLKHYSFTSLIKSDLIDRAIPWTIIMRGNKQYTSDLNLKLKHKLSPLIILLFLISFLLSFRSIVFMLGVPFLLIIFLMLNFDFYIFFLRKKGFIFTLKVFPFHGLYYSYSSLGFLLGLYKFYIRKVRI